MNLVLNKYTLVLLILTSTFLTKAQVSNFPHGENQRASVSQNMGLVKIEVIYNSPDVTSPDGKDRGNQIWGQLIKDGMTKERWMENKGDTTTLKPYRMGANENTIIKVSHDILVEGKKLPAGTYSLFGIPNKDEWTIIFSNKTDSWGHYFYDKDKEALRVKVKTKAIGRQEWLDFRFTDRFLDRCTLIFSWDNLSVPIHFSVGNIRELYVDQIRSELEFNKLNFWYDWMEAAKFCYDNDVKLEQGLLWAEKAINQSWVGVTNFQTLKLKAVILEKLNRKIESDSIMEFAIKYTAGVFDLHNYGRELIEQNKLEQAISIFRLNYERFPDYWLTYLGMARALAQEDKFSEALSFAEAAQSMIPKEEYWMRHNSIKKVIERLKTGERPENYLYQDLTQEY